MKILLAGGKEHLEVQSQCTRSLRSSSKMQTMKNPAPKVKASSTMDYTDSTDSLALWLEVVVNGLLQDFGSSDD